MQDIVIMGSGPAGLTAAIYLARSNCKPLVIEGMTPGGQLTTTTEIGNFPGFADSITGPDLMAAMKQQAEKYGAVSRLAEVEAVDLSAPPFRLTLPGGETIETRVLIVATGASARYLDLPSCRALIGRGVSGCATCDGMFYRGVPVAVVGGGDSAIEEALFLTKFASRVFLIHRRDKLRASAFMAGQAMQHDKIEILWNAVVEEVLDAGKGVVAGAVLRDVTTDQRRELAIDGLFMGIGHTPCTGLFKGQLDLDPEGYILTQSTRTSKPGVFAAGDVQDPVYRQAITAAGSGCIAALEAEKYLQRHPAA